MNKIIYKLSNRLAKKLCEMIKKAILIIFILQISNKIHSQETILKIKGINGVYEEYFVLKDDKKTREGTYVKYTQDILGKLFILETGFYKNNKKEGCWKKFKLNQIQTILYYSDGKLNGDYFNYYLDTLGVKTKKNVLDKWGTKKDSLTIDIFEDNLYIKQNGKYDNDNRIGIWNFYRMDGTIYFSYDFSNNNIILDNITYNDTIEKAKVNELPLYTGGGLWGLFHEVTPFLINYHFSDSISFDIRFTINNSGTLEKTEVACIQNPKYINKKIEKNIELDYNWVLKSDNSYFEIYEFVVHEFRKEGFTEIDIRLK